MVYKAAPIENRIFLSYQMVTCTMALRDLKGQVVLLSVRALK